MNPAKDANVDIDVDLPRPTLPDAPKMPDLPDVPPVGAADRSQPVARAAGLTVSAGGS